MNELMEQYKNLEMKLLARANTALESNCAVAEVREMIDAAKEVNKLQSKQTTMDAINKFTESLNKLADHADSLASLASFMKPKGF